MVAAAAIAAAAVAFRELRFEVAVEVERVRVGRWECAVAYDRPEFWDEVLSPDAALTCIRRAVEDRVRDAVALRLVMSNHLG